MAKVPSRTLKAWVEVKPEFFERALAEATEEYTKAKEKYDSLMAIQDKMKRVSEVYANVPLWITNEGTVGIHSLGDEITRDAFVLRTGYRYQLVIEDNGRGKKTYFFPKQEDAILAGKKYVSMGKKPQGIESKGKNR